MQLAVENSKQKTDQQLIDFCVCLCCPELFLAVFFRSLISILLLDDVENHLLNNQRRK